MTQPLFPSKIGTQSRSAKFLTMKTVVRKPQKNEGQAQTHVLCGCTTFGTEGQGRGYYKEGGGADWNPRLPIYLYLAVFCRLKPLAFIPLYWGESLAGHLAGLHCCWHSTCMGVGGKGCPTAADRLV